MPSIKVFFKSVLKSLKNVFFYTNWTCNACGKEIFTDEYFCKDCKDALPYNDKNVCAHCGRSVSEKQEYCLSCKETYLSVDMARSRFNYLPPVSKMIQRLKYGNRRYLSDYFANELALLYKENEMSSDYITFVPMTKKAKRKRGFNQSELLAKGVSKITGIPIINCLLKTKETLRQANLTRKERLINLNSSFKVTNKKEIKGKKILLVDDVLTTGATSNEIATKLKKAGADKVYLITIASVPSVKPID